MERLIHWSVRRYLGGPGRSWLFASLAVLGYRAVRATVGRKEIVDVGSVGKGEKIVIEHVSETHADQLKAERRAAKAAKKAKKAERRASRVARRAARRDRRTARRDRRVARREERQAAKAA